jgi:uncharacterized membrane protein YcaP (DUF421 family)
MDNSIFFESWFGLGRVLLVGSLSYGMLVLMLRISGKRTLTKLNAFDLVVTVALGSTLATTLLSNSVPLAEGVLAMALLIGLQFALTWSSVRSKAVNAVIKSEPALLLHRGVVLEHALMAQRVTRDEVIAGLRNAGVACIEDAEAVILETDGSLSVIAGGGEENASTALRNVPR